MRHKRHVAAPENHERWLVSYADFITLLFAFFVVMFATSHTDRKKVSSSVRQALEYGQMSSAIAGVLKQGKPGNAPDAKKDAPPPEPPRPDLVQSMNTLSVKLEGELKAGKMGLKLEPRGLVVSMRESAFFASGDDAINPASFATIEKVATVVRSLPNQVRLEGHTDSKPIRTSRFRSNWELSAARSIAMLELFASRFGVPIERMAVAGYAENAPTGSNETEEGRARNRRVDVVLLTIGSAGQEPAPKEIAGSQPPGAR